MLCRYRFTPGERALLRAALAAYAHDYDRMSTRALAQWEKEESASYAQRARELAEKFGSRADLPIQSAQVHLLRRALRFYARQAQEAATRNPGAREVFLDLVRRADLLGASLLYTLH